MSHISVIIVNYNAGIELLACVQSVFKTEDELEVIVVDNDSHDDSIDKLTTYFNEDPRLHIIKNERNVGFSVACNQGSKQAKGSFLLYLNPDCLLEPTTLPRLLDCLEKNPDAGMAGGLILNDDGTEQRGCRRDIPTPWTSLVNTFGLRHLSWLNKDLFKDFRLDHNNLPDHEIVVEAISGACMFMSREMYNNVGPMDEGYFLHCEDLDWCMQFRLKGYQIYFEPTAKLYHSKGSCSVSVPVFVEWSKHKGMVRFYRKFFTDKYWQPMMWFVWFGIWMRFVLSIVKLYVKKIMSLVGHGA